MADERERERRATAIYSLSLTHFDAHRDASIPLLCGRNLFYNILLMFRNVIVQRTRRVCSNFIFNFNVTILITHINYS